MTITNIIAQIKLGRLLNADRNMRIGMATEGRVKFLAARGEKPITKAKPNIVDTNAILRVSTIPRYAFEQKNPTSLSH